MRLLVDYRVERFIHEALRLDKSHAVDVFGFMDDDGLVAVRALL